VDPTVGQDNMEKRKLLTLLGLELQPLGRPASSHSLYRLRYPGSLSTITVIKIVILIHQGLVLLKQLRPMTTRRL
jgi:hypothetical protein